MTRIQKTATLSLFLVLASASFLLFSPYCDNTCRAYEIKRSTVFVQLIKIVNQAKKKSPEAPVVVDKNIFPENILDQNKIQYWGVTSSGVIFIANAKNMLLVAEQKTENGITNWSCAFYPEPISIPICSAMDT